MSNDNDKLPVTTGYKIWDKESGAWVKGSGSSARDDGQLWACKGWAAKALDSDTKELVEVLVIPRVDVDKVIHLLEALRWELPIDRTWALSGAIDALKPLNPPTTGDKR